VAAYQGNTRHNRFDVQSSSDGTAWTAVLTGAQTSGTTTAEQPFDLPATTQGRYIRYVGHGATLNAGGTTAWNSVTEISLWQPGP
jgi:hypothetical protein